MCDIAFMFVLCAFIFTD